MESKEMYEIQELEKIQEIENELTTIPEKYVELKSVAELGLNPIKSIISKKVVEEANKKIDNFKIGDNIEDLEEQKKYLTETEKVLKIKRKLHFANLKADEKAVIGIEKNLVSKIDEIKKELLELNKSIIEEKVIRIKKAIAEYFNEKLVNTFDFVDIQLYCKMNNITDESIKEDARNKTSKFITEKGSIKKSAKESIDMFITKFQTDYYAINQGTEEHIARKLELYQLNNYDLELTIEKYNSWVEAEQKKIEEAIAAAERAEQERIDKEEKEKLMRETARQKAEEELRLKQENEFLKEQELVAKEQEDKEVVENQKNILGEVEVVETIETESIKVSDSRFEDLSDIKVRVLKFSGTKEAFEKFKVTMKITIEEANKCGINIERIEEK